MASILHRKASSYNEDSMKLDINHLSDRQASFSKSTVRWPSSLPSAESMADAGFYYTPNEKSSDCCTCYRCGVKVYNWLPDDTPKIEHKKLSPSCKEVRSWTDIPTEDADRRSINRAEQTEATRFRHKLADKAKRIKGSLHRTHNIPSVSQPLPEESRHVASEAPVNDDQKLAHIRRQREIAEKSLDGLQKLASFYPAGSTEQKRADQQVVLQMADLAKLRDQESQLVSSMGSLSFGRGWHDFTDADADADAPAAYNASAYSHAPSTYDATPASPSNDEDAESPDIARGRMRALPQLPSQLAKNAKPARPARIHKTESVEAEPNLPTYEQFATSTSSFKEQDASSQQQEEWTEYFTDDGVPYYYNAISKQTVWEIPGRDSQPASITSN